MSTPERHTSERPVWAFGRPLTIGFAAMALLVLGFGLWSTLAELSGAIVAPGRIEVEQNRQVVQHPDGGVVAEIRVTEGATVAAGDVLIRLDGTLIASELAIVEGRLSETLAHRARLEAERDGLSQPEYPATLQDMAATRPEVGEQIDGQTRLFHVRAEAAAQEAEQLSRQIEQIRDRIDGIDAQAIALTTQMELIATELASQQSLLEKGLAQQASVLALRREEARLLGQTGELTATRAQAEERIIEIEVQIARAAAARREEATQGLRDIAPVELEMAERQRALTERIARLDIRAPVAGVIIGLAVTTPRAVLRPADPVLYIVPQDRPLVIATQVAPIHVDQVRVGQPVELVFAAFSGRTTPHLQGSISMVSPDALTDSATHASYYRAEVVLDPGQIARLDGQILLPGMPVEAFIQTERRTPLAWLVKPFTDYFSRAFRES